MALSYTVDMQKVRDMTFKRLWTWNDLARRADLAPATIFALLAERRRASTRTVYKIAHALQVEPSEIIKE